MTVILIITLILYRERPTHLASLSSGEERVSARHSFKGMCSNCPLVLLVLVLSLSMGISVSFTVMMESGLKDYGASSQSLKPYVLLSIPVSTVVAISGGVFAGRLGKFKVFVAGSSFLGLLSMLLLVGLLRLKSPAIIGLAFIGLTSGSALCVAVGLELASELAHPLRKSLSPQPRLSC